MGTYVVIDLEMCRVPKKCRTEEYHWTNETIQIGAVVLNENMEITEYSGCSGSSVIIRFCLPILTKM